MKTGGDPCHRNLVLQPLSGKKSTGKKKCRKGETANKKTGSFVHVTPRRAPDVGRKFGKNAKKGGRERRGRRLSNLASRGKGMRD